MEMDVDARQTDDDNKQDINIYTGFEFPSVGRAYHTIIHINTEGTGEGLVRRVERRRRSGKK